MAKSRKKAPPVPKGPSPNVTYTLRTVPRPVWERFSAKLQQSGHTINWAFNKFIEETANGTRVITE